MFTRRSFFKGVAALGLGTVWPNQFLGARSQGILGQSEGHVTHSTTVFPRSGTSPAMATLDLLAIEAREDLLDDLNCGELVARYLPLSEVPEKKGWPGKDWKGPCPFCQAEDLFVGPTAFLCRGCPEEGNALTFFARMEGLTCGEAMRRLRSRLEAGDLKGRHLEHAVLWGIMAEACRFHHQVLWDRPEGSPGRDWLEQQGISRETSKYFDLGYVAGYPSSGQHRAELTERLVAKGYPDDAIESACLRFSVPAMTLPVRDVAGHCWGYLRCRWKQGQESSYWGDLMGMRELSEYRYGRLIYPLPTWPQDLGQEEAILLTDGWWDLIALHQAGVGNAVEIGDLDPPRLRTAFARSSRVIVPVSPAQPMNQRFSEILGEMGGCFDRLGFLRIPDGQTLTEMLQAEGSEAFRAKLAKPVTIHELLGA